jgi:hypothetical protein
LGEIEETPKSNTSAGVSLAQTASPPDGSANIQLKEKTKWMNPYELGSAAMLPQQEAFYPMPYQF